MSDMLKLLLPIVATHIVVLAVIVVVIRRVLVGDTARAVGRVKEVESEIRKKEGRIREQIAEHEQEFEQKKAEAREELQKHREETDRETAHTRDQVLADARKEGERLVDQARKNEGKLRQQIAQDMEEKAVQYAGDIFNLAFTDTMADAVDRVFTNELLDALAEVDSTSITVDAANVAFTAARQMTVEQKQRLERILLEKFNAQVKVEETIDESLVAGLIFKLGSLEIDGSLRNRMQEAVDEVKKTARG